MAKAKAMKEQVAEIVAAYVRKNSIDAAALPGLIANVGQSLATLVEPSAPEPLTPAVPIRRSIANDAITCLDCGYKGKLLKRHLTTAHGLSPEEYRNRWSLPSDYPIVAPAYAARRSALAKSAGLGQRQQPSGTPT
jgi:predicted transcriptional regulator